MASKLKKILNVANPLEKIGDFEGIGEATAKSFRTDLLKGSAMDFADMFGLGTSSTDTKKDSHPEENNIVDFTRGEKSKASKPENRTAAGIDYHRDILKSSERISRQEQQSRSHQIQQLLLEIKSLVSSSKMLEMTVTQVTTTQTVTEVGTYHENFFEWMIKQVQAARKNVEDSSACMNIQKGKAGKKGYWGMFKKHGTSFALSNERGVATQVG